VAVIVAGAAVDAAEPVVVRFGGFGDVRPSPSDGGRAFVFVDKDGTLIEDLPYNVDPRRVRFAPGATQAVRLFAEAGLPLVVCSNQSGVARGYYTVADLRRLAEHLATEVRDLGGELAAFYACPHLPTGSNAWAMVCDCRKPAAGMLTRAAVDLGADLGQSWMIGDTWMDVAAGRTAGCTAILVGPEWRTAGSLPERRRPAHAVPDLLTAARVVVAEHGARRAGSASSAGPSSGGRPAAAVAR
jgi:histidinol-phosphate phosphatase family protein